MDQPGGDRRHAAAGVEFLEFFDETVALGALSLVDVYRFYNAVTGTHFYTASGVEKDMIVLNPSHDPFLAPMTLEGVAYYVLGADGVQASPVWRFYNALTGVHFYTASQAEKDAIVANAGNDPYLAALHLEGVGFWVPDAMWGL